MVNYGSQENLENGPPHYNQVIDLDSVNGMEYSMQPKIQNIKK